MTLHTTEYLIIGNCAAGISAAEAIRSADAEGSVLIVSDEPYAAYGRPLISYLIEGETTEDALWLRDADYYEANDFQTLLGPDYRVVSMDAQAHTVQLAGGDTVSYKSCLVATGSSPYLPETPGLAQQENVFTFTTLDQAKAAWAEAEAVTAAAHEAGRKSRVMISGAGLVGLKAAEAMVGVADEVVVVGRAPFVLRAVLDPVAGPILQKHLEMHGITCLCGVTASEYLGRDGRVTGAVLSDGSRIDCDMLIMAAGVRPNCGFVVEAGAAAGRGLTVDAQQRTTLPDVYAAGDVAEVANLLDGSVSPLAQWPNAVRQGRVAGWAMADVVRMAPFAGNFAINSTNFFDVSVLTCGMTNPPAELGYESHVRAEGDSYAKFVTKDDRLYGYVLVNQPDGAGIYTQLITGAVPLSSLPVNPFDHPLQNVDFPDGMRARRISRGCPARLLRKEA